MNIKSNFFLSIKPIFWWRKNKFQNGSTEQQKGCQNMCTCTAVATLANKNKKIPRDKKIYKIERIQHVTKVYMYVMYVKYIRVDREWR